jgi:glycosyltransferase involved in cell wall biosynthesis
MSRPPVFFVGPRYRHHSGHSGYEGFQRYLGRLVTAPVRTRYRNRAWRVDHAVSSLLSKPHYSINLLLTEGVAAAHMAWHRGAVYHTIYGDTDLRLLGRVGRALKVPVVATFHEPTWGLEWMKIDRELTADLAAVILMSASQRPHFEELVDRERIFVIPHGIDSDWWRPAAEPVSGSGVPICLTVGSKYRDWDVLSEAIDRVHAVLPDVRFVAIGTDVNTDKPLRDERVELLQRVDDDELRRTYQSCQAVVLPLKDATANNALLEAMACGLPVVVSDVGGIREYVGEDCGLVVEPWDAEALAQGILRVLGEGGLARRLGAANRARAVELDFRRIAELHRQVYKHALANGSVTQEVGA